MENSHIEWTNHTFNPWWGCMKVSDGCKNCYAESQDARFNKNNPHWGPNSPRKPMSDAYWRNPFKWNEQARKAGIKAKVFCASMADVFEDHPHVITWRDKLFAIIADTPNLIWQLLTKRPENISKLVPDQWINEQWPSNVWIGIDLINYDEPLINYLEEAIVILLAGDNEKKSELILTDIQWWLYESVDKIIYYDNEPPINLNDIDNYVDWLFKHYEIN